MSYRIGVTASREWADPVPIAFSLGWMCAAAINSGHAAGTADITVIVGRARGGDAIAEAIAKRFGCKIEPHEVTPAQWRDRGRKAGHERNARMVASGANVWLAFILDGSPGATGCSDLAARAGIPVVPYEMSSLAETVAAAVPAWAVDWEECDAIATAGLEEEYGRPLEASYEGTCVCGDRWEPGDMIVYDRAEDRFVHADHAE